MYKIAKISCFFIILASIISCDEKSNFSEKTREIELHSEDFVKKICINDIADSLIVVKLETNTESVFSRITRLSIHSDRIYILSEPDNAILIFDLSGKFISKIHNPGNGPGEFLNLSDFTINTDKDELVLAANIPNKYLLYTIKGEFIKEIKKSDYYRSLNYSNGYFYHIKRISNKQDYRLVIKRNLDGKDHENHLPINQNSTFIASYGTSIITKSQQLLFSSSFHDNNIYSLEKESIFPKYQIDFLKKELPDDYLVISQNPQENMKRFQSLSKSNYFYHISSIREYKNYLLFKFEPRYNCLYNKMNSDIEFSQNFYDLNHRIPLYNYFAHDGDDNFILFIQNPNSVKPYLDRFLNTSSQSEAEKILFTKLGKINTSDNPILFFYRVK